MPEMRIAKFALTREHGEEAKKREQQLTGSNISFIQTPGQLLQSSTALAYQDPESQPEPVQIHKSRFAPTCAAAVPETKEERLKMDHQLQREIKKDLISAHYSLGSHCDERKTTHDTCYVPPPDETLKQQLGMRNTIITMTKNKTRSNYFRNQETKKRYSTDYKDNFIGRPHVTANKKVEDGVGTAFHVLSTPEHFLDAVAIKKAMNSSHYVLGNDKPLMRSVTKLEYGVKEIAAKEKIDLFAKKVTPKWINALSAQEQQELHTTIYNQDYERATNTMTKLQKEENQSAKRKMTTLGKRTNFTLGYTPMEYRSMSKATYSEVKYV